MLATVAAVWWPRLHREVLTLAQSCSQCTESGKNLKTLLPQTAVRTIPAATAVNEEIAIDFYGICNLRYSPEN